MLTFKLNSNARPVASRGAAQSTAAPAFHQLVGCPLPCQFGCSHCLPSASPLQTTALPAHARPLSPEHDHAPLLGHHPQTPRRVPIWGGLCCLTALPLPLRLAALAQHAPQHAQRGGGRAGRRGVVVAARLAGLHSAGQRVAGAAGEVSGPTRWHVAAAWGSRSGRAEQLENTWVNVTSLCMQRQVRQRDRLT